MSLKRDIVFRVGIVYFSLFAFTFLILGKMFALQLFHSHEYQEKAKSFKLREIQPNRGDIYDCYGRLLVSSIPDFEIRMDLRADGLRESFFSKNIDSLAYNLSRLFNDKSREQYKNDLIQARRKNDRYFLIHNHVDFYELKALKNFPIFREGQYKGGLIVVQNNKRYKPNYQLASRTLGYIQGVDGKGAVGIEQAYDRALAGQDHERNRKSKISIGKYNQTEDGMDLVSTIDVNFQDVAHNAILEQLRIHNAHHGTAILMEVKTGDIKAMVNLMVTKDGSYKEVYNHAIGESTEPGSTFKIPALMVALEDGVVDITDTIDTGKGYIQYYDKVVRDERAYGKITVKQVIEHSSNVGISKIITENYKNKEHRFIDRLYNMNLNNKLDLEIKGEGEPHIKYPGDKFWSGISLAMISHGYEVQLTPLQILTFYNAIANNGKMIKPRFVKELQYHGHTVDKIPVKVLNPSICSSGTIRKIREVLEGVVREGTAQSLRNSPFHIAGKTGTAQVAQNNTGYALDGRVFHQASFVGYFPAENPGYSCIVVVNSPNNDVYHGNQVAGPVFQEIANKVYAASKDMQMDIAENQEEIIEPPYTKGGYIPELEYILEELNFAVSEDKPNKNWGFTRKLDSTIYIKSVDFKHGLVPNVKDMGAKDAVYLLESANLNVEVHGRGKVMGQSIPGGAPAKKGDKVVLTMSILD